MAHDMIMIARYIKVYKKKSDLVSYMCTQIMLHMPYLAIQSCSYFSIIVFFMKVNRKNWYGMK